MSHVFEDRIVKARKTHRCYHCLKNIGARKKYILREFIDDGFHRMRMHEECERLANEWDLYGIYGDEEIFEGLFLEELNERFEAYLISRNYVEAQNGRWQADMRGV